MDICTLCSACTAVLTEVNSLLAENDSLRADVLKKLGLKKEYQFGKKTKVKHFARILYEEVGIWKIREMTKGRLAGLRVAPHYGCHYLKPSGIYDDFDDPEHPKTLGELIAATGATPIEFENQNLCCGAGVLAINEKVAYAMTQKKLESIKSAGADAIVLICPFCSVMYDNNQPVVEEKFAREYGIPVLYYPQLLGLALGIPSKELGFSMNRVKADAVLARAK
jgi:heterodisulfide reductase subunit B